MSNHTSIAYSNNKVFSLFNFIQESASIGVWEVDISTMKTTWSHVTKKIHEVPDDYTPCIKTAISFYKAGHSRNKITELFTKCIEDFENFDVDLQIITAKGNEKWVRAIGVADIENGIVKRICGAFQDIDEKTKTSKKIALQEEEFRKTFELASVGMALVSLKGKWLKVNKSLCKMLGYTEKQLLSFTYDEITHYDDLDISKRVFNHLVKRSLDSLDIEKRYIHKNGSIVYVNLAISVVNNDLGNPIHYVYQIKNITNIKTAENEIKELLSISEKQNKQLLNFAHIVSHNLRSHYSNLEMLSTLMEIEIPESTNNDMFPLLKEAINQLGETLDNLNQVTILRANENIDLSKVSLIDAVDKSISSIKASVIKNNATIKTQISKNISVKVVPAYLDSILTNLLTNALKYKSPERDLVIEISAKIRSGYVIIEFKDNGLGIDLKLHGDKIFGMYKTFHNHEDSKGVGLFLIKNQIETIGGSISIESEPNVGTKFLMSLKT